MASQSKSRFSDFPILDVTLPCPKKARGKAPDKSSSDDYSDEAPKPGMCMWVK